MAQLRPSLSPSASPSPAADRAREAERANHEFRVTIASKRQLIEEYVRNISVGGVFVESRRPPALDDVVEIVIDLPVADRQVKASGRVVHIVSPEVAEARGAMPGFGVQFLDARSEDLEIIRQLVQEYRRLEHLAAAPRSTVMSWIVAVGLSHAELERLAPLRRKDLALVALPHPAAALAFTEAHPVALTILAARRDLSPSSELVTLLDRGRDKKTLVLGRRQALRTLYPRELTCPVLSEDVGDAELLAHVAGQLGIALRAHPRVPFRRPVSCSDEARDFVARAVNVSRGGVLLDSPVGCAVGRQLFLTFDLPQAPSIFCLGEVVRSAADSTFESHLLGVKFHGLGAEADEALAQLAAA